MYNAFGQAIDTSIRERVDFVILSGDIFHEPKPDGESIIQMAHQLKKLRKAGIKLYFVLGEHDISRVTSSPVPYVYHKLEFAEWIGDGNPVYLDDIMIAGYDNMRTGELDDLKDILNGLDQKASQHNGHKILVLHQGIKEVNKYAGGLTVDELPKNFTYYAMGHLHDRFEKKFTELGGPLAYPGSTELTNSEKIANNIQKGFYIVDISGDVAIPKWYELNIRQHLRIEADYEDIGDELEKIDGDKKPIIHVVVRGNVKHEDLQLHMKRIEGKMLASRCTIESNKNVPPALLRKPTTIDEEILRLSREYLKSEELADFAIKQLLPVLSDRPGEALHMVIDQCKKLGGKRS